MTRLPTDRVEALMKEVEGGLGFPSDQAGPALDDEQITKLASVVLRKPEQLAFYFTDAEEEYVRWVKPGWNNFEEMLRDRLRSGSGAHYDDLLRAVAQHMEPAIPDDVLERKIADPRFVFIPYGPDVRDVLAERLDSIRIIWSEAAARVMQEGRVLAFRPRGAFYEIVDPIEWTGFAVPVRGNGNNTADLRDGTRFVFTRDLPPRFQGKDPGGLRGARQASKEKTACAFLKAWAAQTRINPRRTDVSNLLEERFELSKKAASRVWSAAAPVAWSTAGKRKDALGECGSLEKHLRDFGAKTRS